MGMFLSFDEDKRCNWCDHLIWKCTCGPKPGEVIEHKPIVWSKQEPHVSKGDIICRAIEDGKVIDQAYVVGVDPATDDAPVSILKVQYLDGRHDGAITVWEGRHFKIANALGAQ